MTRISAVTVRDFKRIKAATINIDADTGLVLVGGKNGAGKSSFLDALTVALAGTKAMPANPIRDGAESGLVEVQLEDGIIVKRTFTRKLDGGFGGDLTITSAEGARYPSPQSWLNSRIGEMSCDPVAFLGMEPAKQAALLRKIAGVDVSALDARLSAAEVARTEIGRDGKVARGALASLPRYDDAPADPVVAAVVEAELVDAPQQSAAEILAEIRAAEATEKAASDADKAVLALSGTADKARLDIAATEQVVARLRAELADAEARLAGQTAGLAGLYGEIGAAQAAADTARAAVVPSGPIRERLVSLEADNNRARYAAAEANAAARKAAAEVNAAARAAADLANDKRRANAAYAAKKAEVEQLRAAHAAKTAEIEAIRQERVAMLAAAKFPVDGLSFSEKGTVTFQSQPLDQASSAEKIRVSMAVALAGTPATEQAIRLVLIRDGSLLDDDSRALVVEAAEAAGAQVIMEVVGTRDPGAVVIVDGGTV